MQRLSPGGPKIFGVHPSWGLVLGTAPLTPHECGIWGLRCPALLQPVSAGEGESRFGSDRVTPVRRTLDSRHPEARLDELTPGAGVGL